MTKLPIEPPIHVRAGLGRTLNSMAEAIEFVREWTGRRAGPDWGEVLILLEASQAPEQVPAATAALMVLLEAADLLAPDNDHPTGAS